MNHKLNIRTRQVILQYYTHRMNDWLKVILFNSSNFKCLFYKINSNKFNLNEKYK